MKTMTCKQLGGACDHEFQANSFEEMTELSQKHGLEMMGQGDQAHIEVMQKMRENMNDPQSMQEWMEKVHQEFDALPEED